MDTPKPTPLMIAKIKPVSVPAKVPKRAFTPKPHLTQRPFNGLRDMMNTSRTA